MIKAAPARLILDFRDFPETVGGDEFWYGNVYVVNIGGEPSGLFDLRVTGDIAFQYANIWQGALVPLKPGWNWRFWVWGIGPANFQVHLYSGEWAGEVVYHGTISPKGAGALEAPAPARAVSDAVTVVVRESPVDAPPPAAAWVNPNFPAEVGPDEEWWGTIEACNSGGRTGHLFIVSNVGWKHVLEFMRAGERQLLTMQGFGPLDFDLYLYASELTELESQAMVVAQRTSPPGDLRNLKFPKFGVESTEPWEGSVEAWNAGSSTETFRLNVTGDIPGISESFVVDPGGHSVVTFGGTGPTPTGFMATLQRLVGVEWVDDDYKEEVVGQRITRWIRVEMRVDLPSVHYEPVKGAKFSLDGEHVLDTSGSVDDPVYVASGREYDGEITYCGFLHVGYYIIERRPVSWNDIKIRVFRFNLRNGFP